VPYAAKSCWRAGWGAWQSLSEAGITPILRDVEGIDAAVTAHLAGEIVDYMALRH